MDDENGSSSVSPRLDGLSPPTVRGRLPSSANVRSPRLSALFGIEGTNPFSDPSAALRDQCVKIGNNLWLAGPNILADDRRVLLPPISSKSASHNCVKCLSTC